MNIRITLERAELTGIISPDESSTLFAEAQRRYYPDRIWTEVIRGAGLPSDRVEAILSWVRTSRVDQKQDDARAALKYIASLIAHNSGVHP